MGSCEDVTLVGDDRSRSVQEQWLRESVSPGLACTSICLWFGFMPGSHDSIYVSKSRFEGSSDRVVQEELLPSYHHVGYRIYNVS